MEKYFSVECFGYEIELMESMEVYAKHMQTGRLSNVTSVNGLADLLGFELDDDGHWWWPEPRNGGNKEETAAKSLELAKHRLSQESIQRTIVFLFDEDRAEGEWAVWRNLTHVEDKVRVYNVFVRIEFETEIEISSAYVEEGIIEARRMALRVAEPDLFSMALQKTLVRTAGNARLAE